MNAYIHNNGRTLKDTIKHSTLYKKKMKNEKIMMITVQNKHKDI